jgi:uncharacterized protein
VSSETTHQATVDIERELVGFAGALRREGVPVGMHEVGAALDALQTLDQTERDAFYWALRLAMVHGPDELAAFDRAFGRHWAAHPERRDSGEGQLGGESPVRRERRGPGEAEAQTADRDAETSSGTRSLEPGDASELPSHGLDEKGAYSALEVLRTKDFATYSPEDYARFAEAVRVLAISGPWRISRRARRHRSGRLDVRRTIAGGLRSGGPPMRREFQRPTPRRRRLVFVCDISGSMASYSAALLHLTHAAVRGRERVEVFAFATRLTRITSDLVESDPARAIEGASARLVDWSGGTRIGASIGTLVREYSGLVRGSTVLVASDGWDCGDPGELEAAVDRLSRLARHVIWVNPQLQDPAFEPLTKGMSAALPHVDHFLPCHNLESFVAVGDLIDRL